jgi:integrase
MSAADLASSANDRQIEIVPRHVRDKIATPHGFRSSFRDWAAEIAYFPSEVIEHVLAHKLKDRAEAAYQGGTLLERALRRQREHGDI